MPNQNMEEPLEQLRKIFGIVDEEQIVSDSDYERSERLDDWGW